ncbi:hypothetical protein D3C81_1619120 [compost metagenome]
MWFKEDERRVLLQQLTYFGFAVRFAPVADRLHRHIFFLHFATVDQYFTNTAVGMTVFPGIAKEVKRAAIAKVDIAATLHIHNEVIHQGVAVGKNIVVTQRPGVDFSTRW